MDAEAVSDILHLMFEEDFVDSASKSPEAATRKDGIRKELNEKVYDRPYTVWLGQNQNPGRIPETATGLDDDNDDLDAQLDRLAASQVTVQKKPYIPPTELYEDSPLPFGSVLDPPVG